VSARRPRVPVRQLARTAPSEIDLRCLPLRVECLADALDNRTNFGVWGGMTDRERRALLRRRPDVRSWLPLLLAARDEWTAQAEASGGAR